MSYCHILAGYGTIHSCNICKYGFPSVMSYFFKVEGKVILAKMPFKHCFYGVAVLCGVFGIGREKHKGDVCLFGVFAADIEQGKIEPFELFFDGIGHRAAAFEGVDLGQLKMQQTVAEDHLARHTHNSSSVPMPIFIQLTPLLNIVSSCA